MPLILKKQNWCRPNILMITSCWENIGHIVSFEFDYTWWSQFVGPVFDNKVYKIILLCRDFSFPCNICLHYISEFKVTNLDIGFLSTFLYLIFTESVRRLQYTVCVQYYQSLVWKYIKLWKLYIVSLLEPDPPLHSQYMFKITYFRDCPPDYFLGNILPGKLRIFAPHHKFTWVHCSVPQDHRYSTSLEPELCYNLTHLSGHKSWYHSLGPASHGQEILYSVNPS